MITKGIQISIQGVYNSIQIFLLSIFQFYLLLVSREYMYS